MRAILIDAEKQTVTEINFAGNYTKIQEIIGCRDFTIGSRPLRGSFETGFDALYVSDDYLEDREDPRYWFQVDADRAPPSSFPIAGRGLVLGVDERGEDCAAEISVAALTPRITFTQRKFLGFVVSEFEDGVSVAVNAPIIDGTT